MPTPGNKPDCQGTPQTGNSHPHRRKCDRSILFCASVVHGKGVQIQWGIATLQSAEVYGLPIDAAAQQQLVHLRCQINPGWRVGVHALAQRRTRWNNAKTQRTLEEGVVAKTLNGVKVALAQTQKGKVAFENFTVGNPRAHGKYRIDQRIDVDAFEVFANKRQACVGAEVVGQFLIIKSVMFEFTCWVIDTCGLSR